MQLTIGIAAYDEFDSLFFTVQALRIYHDLSDCEIVVVDNNPDGPAADAIKGLIRACKSKGRYVPYRERGSCPPRDHIFTVAESPYVLVIDSHVLLLPGSIDKLLQYYRDKPDTSDLIHGALLFGMLSPKPSTHMIPEWRSEMYGRWAKDPRGENPEGEPFQIPMHGLGLFSCRKTAWPGFTNGLVGFSGGEGAIHAKFRNRGDRVLCHPGVRWVHKFVRVQGTPFHVDREEKIKNVIRAWDDTGIDLLPMVNHYCGGVGMKDSVPLVPISRMRELFADCKVEFVEPTVTNEEPTIKPSLPIPYNTQERPAAGSAIATHFIKHFAAVMAAQISYREANR